MVVMEFGQVNTVIEQRGFPGDMESRRMLWPFGSLNPFSAAVIKADPPWSFANWSEAGEEKNAKAHYSCMPTEDIAAMPVGHLAQKDCWIWMWATHPMLPEALHVMSAWGFQFVTSGVWVKRGTTGKLAFGTGYVLRSCSEPFLIGKIGDPPTFSKSIRTVLEAPRQREHSRKPDSSYEVCERLFGPGPRIELFGRQSRPGWTVWGDQSTLFDADEPVSTRRAKEPAQTEPASPMPLFPDAA